MIQTRKINANGKIKSLKYNVYDVEINLNRSKRTVVTIISSFAINYVKPRDICHDN